MWARIVELLLGVWLAASPLVFRNTASYSALFASIDLAAGSAVIVLSLLSFWQPTRWAHFVTGGLALALACVAYFGWERPGPPAAQNEITVGLVLLLMAIVPNEASQPPVPWRPSAPAASRSPEPRH